MINIEKTGKRIFKDTLKQIRCLGSYQFHAIITIMFLLTQKYEEFIFLLLGYFIMKIFLIPVRIIFFKQRPRAEKYENIFEKISSSSFPSFHATRTTFLLIFLIYFFSNTLISIFLTALALTSMYSRIYFKRHYLIDIIAGIGFGIITYYSLRFLL